MYKKLFTALLTLLILGVSSTCTMAISHAMADAPIPSNHSSHTDDSPCDEQKSCDKSSSCCIDAASKQTYVADSNRLTLITEALPFPASHGYQFNHLAFKAKDYSIQAYIAPLTRTGITIKKE